MFWIALQTIKRRWVSFTGMFVALSLGVGLIGSMGLVLFATFSLSPQNPQRFANAPAVVQPVAPAWAASLYVTERQEIALERGISPETARKIAATGPTAIDRAFYAQIVGSRVNSIGHPWSSAAFGPYAIQAGRAPQHDTEIVVAAGSADLNQAVTIISAQSKKTYKVVGLTNAVDFESALFFADTEAAKLSPRIDAIVSSATSQAVHAAIGSDNAEVLTGMDRSKLDPDLFQKQQALNNISILTGIAAAISGFIAIFIVASTFALAVAQRLREFALLRIIGALPGQIRQMVFTEALVIGVSGSLMGCLLATFGGTLLVDWLIGVKFAPAWFTASSSPVPLILAFIIGLAVAMFGVVAASYRASRVRPIEALRETTVPNTVMTASRWALGLSVLGIGITALTLVALVRPRIALVQNIFINALMFAVAGFALLSPIAIRFLTRLVTAPFMRTRGAIGLLVRANTLAAIRRTAATVAPVLLTVGLTLSLLSAVATIDESRVTERRNQLRADYVVAPQAGSGVNATTIEALRKINGIEVVPFTQVMMYALDDTDGINPNDAEAVDPSLLPKALNINLSAGTLDLRDDSIIVSDDWHVDVGQDVRVRLTDDRTVTLRVVGTFPIGTGRVDAYVSQKFAEQKLASYVGVVVSSQADTAQVAQALGRAVKDQHARVVPQAEWVKTANAPLLQASWLGLLLTIGVTSAYSAIAIINTMVMAISGRLRDLSTLQLSGATKRQILSMVAGEALVVAIIGIVLAAGASAINFVGLQIALAKLVGATPLVISWPAVGVAVVGSVALTVCAAVLPVYFALGNRSALQNRHRMNE